MKEREELELILKLIGKYNLPLSPILEYAVKEKMEEYPEDEQTTEIVKEGWENEWQNTPRYYSGEEMMDMSDMSGRSGYLDKKEEDTHEDQSLIENENQDTCELSDSVTIQNIGRSCHLVNSFGEKVYSSSGKILQLDRDYYRVIYTWSSISITKIERLEDGKFITGERILLAKYRSPMFQLLDKDAYLEQIEKIMQLIGGEYEVKVEGIWYNKDGYNPEKPFVNTTTFDVSKSKDKINIKPSAIKSYKYGAKIGEWILWKPTGIIGQVIERKTKGTLRKLIIKLKDGSITEVYDNRKAYDILTKPYGGQTTSIPVDIKNTAITSEDRRIGYTVRLFPSQIKGEIIRVKKDEKGIKKLVVKANNGTIIEINDMPYLYEVLRRK